MDSMEHGRVIQERERERERAALDITAGSGS